MDNKELYKRLLSELRDGQELPDLDDVRGIISPSSSLETSRNVRDVFENAIGNEYLKNTGVSVPDIRKASKSQVESFLNKLKEEAYPDLNDISVELRGGMQNARGEILEGGYSPSGKNIMLNPDVFTDRDSLAGTTFHEAGHALDFKNNPDTLSIDDSDMQSKVKRSELRDRGIKSDSQLNRLDPVEINEIRQKGHHLSIPERKDSWGLSNLRNIARSKALRALPLIGPLAAGLTSDDASAAMPILGEAEELGPSKGSAEHGIENPNLSQEERIRLMERLRNN